jgi:hypothetical protein
VVKKEQPERVVFFDLMQILSADLYGGASEGGKRG